MKASTSLRKLGLYYAFAFSTVIIYPPFFSEVLLNSSKTLALHVVTPLNLALFQVDALRKMVMIEVFEEILKQVQTHSAVLQGKHGDKWAQTHTPVLADSGYIKLISLTTDSEGEKMPKRVN